MNLNDELTLEPADWVDEDGEHAAAFYRMYLDSPGTAFMILELVTGLAAYPDNPFAAEAARIARILDCRTYHRDVDGL